MQNIKKVSRYSKIILVLLVFAIIGSTQLASASFLNNTVVSIRTGISKQDFMFETPAAFSILDWQGENIGFGLEVKHNFVYNNATFGELELDYSSVNGGEAHDDDISNDYGAYSKGEIGGKTSDLKVKFGYQFDLNKIGIDSLSLAPTVGAFYKNIHYYSKNKKHTDPYNGLITLPGICNETNSTIYGFNFGVKLETKNTEKIKSSVKLDYIVPIYYKGKQTWHKRTPILHWQLENTNRESLNLANSNGFRIKYEQKHLVNSALIKHIIFYTSYEKIVVKNLKESKIGFSYAGSGKVQFDGFNIGLGFEF